MRSVSLLAWIGRRVAVSPVQRVKISINHFQLSHALTASQRAPGMRLISETRPRLRLRFEMEEGTGHGALRGEEEEEEEEGKNREVEIRRVAEPGSNR